MSRQKHRETLMEGLIMPTKIRKRGFSSSSSSSSRIRSYRLNKRIIRVGKNRVGHGIGIRRSRSITPVLTLRMTPLRSCTESSKNSVSGKSSTQPVSARRLAATLWEMNEMPSPRMSESNLELKKKMHLGWGLHSGSGSSVSEKMDRSATVGCRRTPTISKRLASAEPNPAAFDSISNASFTETKTKSHTPSSSRSTGGDRSHLKDISNALTTSKELLKIIHRMWARADQPSSSVSVISALHAELERARVQVNHLMEERNKNKTEINYLLKFYAEEKASWKSKQNQAIEAAVASVAGELETERKLRKQAERLNKELGKELEEMRLKVEMVKMHQEAEKEPLEGKNHYGEKSSAIGKLRKQLEGFLGSKRDKLEDKGMISSRPHIDREIKARRSMSVLRSRSDGVQESDREADRRSCCEEGERYRAVRDLLKDRVLSNSHFSSPWKGEQSWPSRDPCVIVNEPHPFNGSKSRMGGRVRSNW